MYWTKLAFPWHYAAWRDPQMSSDHEIGYTRLARLEGLWYMLRVHWMIIHKERDSGKRYYDLECFWWFFAQNYPPFLCLIGYLVGFSDCGTIALVWLATFVYGTLRYIGWLTALLFRWPPLANS